MNESILYFLANFPKPLAVYISAMLPVTELRASIPVGILIYHLQPIWVYCLAVLGNLTPIIFILLFLKKLDNFLRSHFKYCTRFFDWLYAHTYKKGGKQFEKWGAIALVAFVAIPLPITGAWTGSVLALLFEVPFKKSFPLIVTGVIIAGIIVTAITLLGVNLLQ